MKNLFDPAATADIIRRLDQLGPGNVRQWGTMSAPQALAHCSVGMELAMGTRSAPRLFIGRLIGGLIKGMVVRDDAPMRRNSPTAPVLVVADERDFAVERERLRALVTRFAAGGPGGCTTNPHAFFGRLTPEEWAVLLYKHLDHHLRQFAG
jgi:hypothetical protein